MARAGLVWLEENYQHVNSLNVFPVPDGDTGTNMLLTMRSAVTRAEGVQDEHVGRVAVQLAQGALMGARGNSGVILSQIWRGLGQSLQDKEEFTANDLAKAFKQASDTAYKGVMRPVEGTLLTVIRAGAVEADEAARKSSDLRFVLERVLESCEQALERTPDQLPVLKQAGVVDSGGQGLVYIFQGMLRYAHGQLALDNHPLTGRNANCKQRSDAGSRTERPRPGARAGCPGRGQPGISLRRAIYLGRPKSGCTPGTTNH
ncbi:MAG: DAK2 domain-containing protein [Chloroflexota bacterium]